MLRQRGTIEKLELERLELETGEGIKEYPQLNRFLNFPLNYESYIKFQRNFNTPSYNCYSLDRYGFVNGLWLDDIEIDDYYILSSFKNLAFLHLHNVPIGSPLILSQLKNLRSLWLYDNQIEDISFIIELPHLSCFSNGGNDILDFSPIESLKQLSVLGLSANFHEAQDFSFLKNSKNLKLLQIHGVFLLDLSFIENLTDLYSLGITSAGITEISSIKSLNKLINLDFSKNKISDISPLQFIPSIRKANFKKNIITKIPKNIFDLDHTIICEKTNWDKVESGINLFQNPIKSPPIEILEKGRKSVIDYFESLEGEKKAINEVKVILVGDGGSGKTSLLKQLLGEKFNQNESQTHGINIRNWNAKRKDTDITVHFWDFGGQEIMHSTHQFFLSKRCLYILVLDGRKDEKTEYWLKHIESFGGDSPILVVLNKIDQNPAFDVNRKFLKEKYKGVSDFYRVSCAEQIGIDDFSDSLISELSRIEILETTWAKSWFNVKSQLEKMQHPFISFKVYNDLCHRENISEESSKETLVQFLHDLGVIMHFSDIQLLDTHVLEPRWVTEAVYKVINSKELTEGKGTLKTQQLNEILKKKDENDYFYPPDKYGFIIDLMMKFELCYDIDKHTILIPDLLEIQEPEYDFEYDNSLKFIFEYDFLPKSIMPRFLVRMHKDIWQKLRWRTGAVLKDDDCNCLAIIKADEREKKIFIYINGERKRDYFSIIRRTFRDINGSFENLPVTELVPLPDRNDICIEYDELTGYELMGKEEYTIGKLRKSYNVSELLNGIEKEEDRKRQYKRDEIGDIYNIKAEKVSIGKKEEKASKNIVTIGDNATLHGDVLIGNKIKDSFNKVDSSDVSDDLRELLKTLSKDIASMAESLPEELSEQIANDLQAFTNEATSEKPRKQWWELSAKGMKEAAKTVGEIGLSVIKNLDKIIPILDKL